MKLAVLGGSYNPIHIGHLMLADAVCNRYGYDTVAFVPAFMSPFKKGHTGCTAEDRLAMVELAIADNPAFYCEPCEIRRQGISYTIDTLKFLKERYPHCKGKIGLVIGDDLLEGFPYWQEATQILQYADLIVGSRFAERCVGDSSVLIGKEGALFTEQHTDQKNFTVDGVWKFSETYGLKGMAYLPVDNALLPVSSSGIRTAIKEKKSWRYLVPPAVYSYIREHKLYE